MRILLVTDPYPPEICSAAGLMKELAEALSTRGHDVTILTVSPGYKLAEDDIGKIWPEFTLEDGISVIRAPTFALRHTGYIRRGLATILAPFQMWRGLKRHVKDDFDAVFIYSPPITLGLIGTLLKRLGTVVVLNVQDIFPQNAIDLGILRNPIVIAFFRWIEKLSYKYADIITAHSKGNLDLLASTNPDLSHKFVLLHNWIDEDSYTCLLGRDFRKLFNLENKIVALFAGVIGPSQGGEMLVEVADRVRDLDDLVFLVAGDGTEKKRMEDLVCSRGLSNIIFKPFVSPDDYPDLLFSSDIGLVCLSPDVKTPVVPGKMLGYMAASLPIAAFINNESDAHQMIIDAECGFSSDSSDTAGMEKIIRKFYNNPDMRKKMGANGRKYGLRHFSKEHIIIEIEELINGVQVN